MHLTLSKQGLAAAVLFRITIYSVPSSPAITGRTDLLVPAIPNIVKCMAVAPIIANGLPAKWRFTYVCMYVCIFYYGHAPFRVWAVPER